MTSTSMPNPTSAFDGLESILTNTNNIDIDGALVREDVEDDLEGEEENLRDLPADDTWENSHDSHSGVSSNWRETIAGASKGITDKTDSEYRRLINQCVKFLIDKGMIKKREDFVCKNPPEDSPFFIAAWIMDHCDDMNLDGTPKPASQRRDTYSHGQKMRASMTHLFGRQLGLGNERWRKSDISGKMTGNPAISDRVGTYMISLRNRKVRNGETPTSARAITSKTLLMLYDENHKPENWRIDEYVPGTRGQRPDQWGGGMARRALGAIYTIAFLCLLRSDEVLKIKREHIVLTENGITLTLPFRKTHQGGGIEPFYLRIMSEDEAHLCPVRALADWIYASKITSGYLFRRIASGDRPSQEDSPMTSEQFLELFRNNLLDIEVDPMPYGTHSFRRGGCQYLAADRRWTLRRICEWGGWSTEFSNLTIVRYLISWNDNPTERREDFFNPNRPPAALCFQCGRDCYCASKR